MPFKVGNANAFKERPTKQNRVIVQWAATVGVSALVAAATSMAIQGRPMHATFGGTPFGAAGAGFVSSGSAGADSAIVAESGAAVPGMSVTAAVRKAKPAVMGVVNYAQVSNYFTQQTRLQPTGVGTGVLFYKDNHFGYAVTNNHVVEGSYKVDVVLESSKHVKAQVVGTDPYTDLAVLKIPVKDLRNTTPVAFANSDALEAGEPAIAIGTPMGLDFADSVTAGIVSATKRIMPVEEPSMHQTLDYQAVIQTDAAINPGNSGGPLINIGGQVIGINSSKIVAPNFEGMGFAIPSNEVVTIAGQLMKTGHAVHPALGVEGYSLASLPEQMWPDVPVDYGVWVKAVTSRETEAAGVKSEDVIVSLDGKPVKNMADLRTYLFQEKPSGDATLVVFRGNRKLNLHVKIGTMETRLTTDSNAPSQAEADNSDPLDPFESQY